MPTRYYQSIDTIPLPKYYTAYIFGSATVGGWKQEVKIKVQSTDGDDETECTFQGVKNPLKVTGGGMGFMNQEAVVVTADDTTDRQIEIDFKVLKNGASSPSAIKGFDKDMSNPFNWVTNYTYSTEDGGDNDFHDTTLVVSLIKDIK